MVPGIKPKALCLIKNNLAIHWLSFTTHSPSLMTIFLSLTEGKSFIAPVWSSLSISTSFQEGALLSVELDEIMPLGTGEDEPQAYFSFYIFFYLKVEPRCDAPGWMFFRIHQGNISNLSWWIFGNESGHHSQQKHWNLHEQAQVHGICIHLPALKIQTPHSFTL